MRKQEKRKKRIRKRESKQTFFRVQISDVQQMTQSKEISVQGTIVEKKKKKDDNFDSKNEKEEIQHCVEIYFFFFIIVFGIGMKMTPHKNDTNNNYNNLNNEQHNTILNIPKSHTHSQRLPQ